jgi:hypothetical protein
MSSATTVGWLSSGLGSSTITVSGRNGWQCEPQGKHRADKMHDQVIYCFSRLLRSCTISRTVLPLCHIQLMLRRDLQRRNMQCAHGYFIFWLIWRRWLAPFAGYEEKCVKYYCYISVCHETNLNFISWNFGSHTLFFTSVPRFCELLAATQAARPHGRNQVKCWGRVQLTCNKDIRMCEVGGVCIITY